jgi:hypothetical protein
MLVIMLVMIGHDAVPHIHDHAHTHTHTDFDHHHAVDHDAEKSVWDRLFEEHTRTNHSHKYTHTSRLSTFVKREITSAFLLPDVGIINSSCTAIDIAQGDQFSRSGTIKFHLHANGLRAPPFYT